MGSVCSCLLGLGCSGRWLQLFRQDLLKEIRVTSPKRFAQWILNCQGSAFWGQSMMTLWWSLLTIRERITTLPRCPVKALYWCRDRLLLPGLGRLQWYFKFPNCNWMRSLEPLRLVVQGQTQETSLKEAWIVRNDPALEREIGCRLPEVSLRGRRLPCLRWKGADPRPEVGCPRREIPLLKETRMDQMALWMESMMARMERLEGSSRSSRRSGTSHSRSFRDRLLPEGARLGPDPLWDNLRVPVFADGPRMLRATSPRGVTGWMSEALSNRQVHP